MSYWKAFAQARDERGDLFERHVAALEALHHVAAALDVTADNRTKPTDEEALLEAVRQMKEDLKDARAGEDKADEERRSAESSLDHALAREVGLVKQIDEWMTRSTLPSELPTIGRLEARAGALLKERDQALGELDVIKAVNDELLRQVEALRAESEAHADALAAARTFVARAEKAGLKARPRHARPVPR